MIKYTVYDKQQKRYLKSSECRLLPNGILERWNGFINFKTSDKKVFTKVDKRSKRYIVEFVGATYLNVSNGKVLTVIEEKEIRKDKKQ